jgi:hypothetical protein
MTPSGEEHELGLMRFIVPARRDRFHQSLTNERLRSKLARNLHARQVDQRHAELVPHDWREPDVRQRLSDLGAPATCWVVSDNPDLDARCLALENALEQLLFQDAIGFVSCVPGRLALFSDEAPGDQWVLRRDA